MNHANEKIMRNVSIPLLLSLLCVSNVSAQLSNSCDALLQHGINNITRYRSAEHAIAYKWDKHCRYDLNSSSDSVIHNADAEIFSFSGSSNLNVDQKRQRVTNFCTENKAFAQANLNLAQEAKILSIPGINAWQQCIRMARKDIRITMTPSGTYDQFVHFEIDSSHDGELRFLGLEKEGYECNVAMVREGESVNTSDQPYIRNANIQIDCTREDPQQTEISGVGRIQYSPAYIAVNTSGPSLAVSFPEVVSEYYVTPPGTVIAFTANHCPEGWSSYSDADNRFILGSSTSNPLYKTGGRPDIPTAGNHSHSTEGINDGNWEPNGHLRESSQNRNHYHGTDTKGNHNHGGNNVPPFIALKYCKRELPSR
uniref:Uncharacterized protein n=1 Tax=Candidatus Kentrum sp. LFY TaxID=2126342 RepID=A0A450V3P5_9GAMM|nr:MAG: hypothetical protein BECKLFY1418A_GA0070994_10977 [Candidatus Kentron sp. LFY]